MLDRPDENIDGTAVLWDQDHTLATYAAAELLAQRFARLVIVTPRERLASDVGLVTRQGIYRRLYGMPKRGHRLYSRTSTPIRHSMKAA